MRSIVRIRPFRARSLTLSAALLATVLQALAPAIAAADTNPSVPLPATSSVPVSQQAMGSRPPDQATTSALHGDQGASTPPEGAGSNTATSLAPSATWDVSAYTGDFS